MEPASESKKLRLRDRTLHPEQEPVVGVARVVHGRLVGQQRLGDDTDLHQPVPVGRRPRQPRRLQGQDDADLAGADLGQELLEPLRGAGRAARAALVLVDRLDGSGRPAQGLGALGQGVLAGGALAVAADLVGAGLADVDDRLAAQVAGLDFRLPCSCHAFTSCVGAGRRPRALRTMAEKQWPKRWRSGTGSWNQSWCSVTSCPAAASWGGGASVGAAQPLAVAGQAEQGRGKEFWPAPGQSKALRRQIGPRRRHRGSLSVGELQDDPWLILPPKGVEEAGEFAADLAAMLADSDRRTGKK